ncbi:MAG: gluconate 2-dehydrogenase subunit 3 family protein [Bryobacteraceae bacterium]
MSETRRETLIKIASAVSLANLAQPALSQTQAEHVHQATAQAKAAGGTYKPKLLTAHEFKTLQVLSELIVPGASKGNTAEFIDYLCHNNKDLAAIYTGGLSWLDATMQKRASANFVDSKPAQQTELLDLIAYRKNEESNPELGPGIHFFRWARRMSVDGYYTSAAGIKEVGFLGNGASSKFEVKQELYDQVLRKAGFA